MVDAKNILGTLRVHVEGLQKNEKICVASCHVHISNVIGLNKKEC